MLSEDAKCINALMKHRVAQRGQFCFIFAVASYLSFLPDKHNSALSCLANNFEKYIHTKIEANLLKLVAYITLEIHVPLLNP